MLQRNITPACGGVLCFLFTLVAKAQTPFQAFKTPGQARATGSSASPQARAGNGQSDF